MCGRYTARFSDQTELPEAFAAVVPDFAPRYNIAPQQLAPVIRLHDGTPRFEDLRWGFRPAWMKDKNKGQINARAETVFEKPMFKHSAFNRRCLVLASGWYEWQKTSTGKQPLVFHRQDDALFAFAGIWTRWHDEADVIEDSYAILTTDANTLAARVHNRMPVILDADACLAWLNTSEPSRLKELLVPYSHDDLDAYPVSTYVNSPRHAGRECLEPITH